MNLPDDSIRSAKGAFKESKMVLKKNAEDLLQEEFLQEKAAVLGRAGDSVARAIEKMRQIEERLEEHLNHLREIELRMRQGHTDNHNFDELRSRIMQQITIEIGKYNGERENALLRYYYLIVTREAMGLRRHHWVEQQYGVPPPKIKLQDN